MARPYSNDGKGSTDTLTRMREAIWNARIPLEIRIAASECRTYDQVDPYLIACPRLAYLPRLLPRLLKFFSPHLIADISTIKAEAGCFSYDSIFLKWHLPIGLLYDIYLLSTEQIHSRQQLEPFRLTVHFSPENVVPGLSLVPSSERALQDAFINSVKEADFLRSGTAKPIMSLSAADSRLLWSSAQENDIVNFAKVHDALMPAVGQLRNVPLRVYIPSSNDKEPGKAQIKTVQAQFSPMTMPPISTTASQLRGPSSGQQQTLGTALHGLLPSLFPSRRTPILAKPLLHGAQIPMAANLEDLARKCCYADGWINIVVAMTN